MRNPGFDFTKEEFEEMIASSCTNNLITKIYYYTKELTSSNSYWNRVRHKLDSIIRQVGVPTIFFILSMAQFHWPDFLNLFQVESNYRHDFGDIRNIVTNNLHLVDWYFTERTELFVKTYLYEHLGVL